MNRLAFLVMSAALALPLFAQNNSVSSIRIFTDPPGARFYVDGQLYSSAQVFTWPIGSRHVVEFPLLNDPGTGSEPYQLSLDGSTRFTFGGWADNAGLLVAGSSTTQVIVANPAITSLKATVSVSYRIQLRFTNTQINTGGCGSAPGDPDSTTAIRTGLVYVGSQCYAGNADLFLAPGDITLNAFPYPGFVFLGWSINGSAPTPYLVSFPIGGPTAIAPIFVQGKRVQFITDPPGLQVLINRTPTPTSSTAVLDRPLTGLNPDAIPYCDPDYLRLPPGAPSSFPPLCYGEFDFIPNSTHVIGGVSPQLDATGKPWVFSKWSNGLGDHALYRVGQAGPREVLVAQYKRGVNVSLMTSPPGLRLNVNGRENWPAYNFMFAAGSEHRISAVPSQTDRRGRRWVFKRWSDGGEATRTLTVPEDSEGIALTAVFEVLPQVTLRSNPPGLQLNVDGANCAAPCVLDREPGTEITVVVPERIGMGDDSRLEFTGWSDGEGTSRKVAFSSDSQTLTVGYQFHHRLVATADPQDGMNFRYDPPSADSFYPAETAVSVTAEPKPGFKFRRWGGDLDGTYPAGTLVMSSAKGVIAFAEKVPFIPPAGVQNAAGETPDPAVAPGSLIAIYGENLAREFEAGRTNPLAQTIGGVTVQMRDRYLPLLFVSEKQINAMLPSDIGEGEHELVVRRSGEPDVKGKFTVSRNAPGLFTRKFEDGTELAMAQHADGKPLASDNPAQPREVLTFYGTGFGPAERPWVDGFDIPSQPEFKLADTVEVRAGDYVFETVWAGFAPGMTGMVIVKARVPDGMPPGALMDVKAVIGGKSSNLVKLPVQ